MNIIVDSSSLVSISNEVISETDEFKDNINKITSEIESLKTVWTGKDATSFISAMNEKILVSLSDLKDVLDKYSDIVTGIAEAYDALDESFSGKSIEV